MSHHSVTIDRQHGPLVRVLVGVSQPRQAAILQAGGAVPQPVEAMLLVDTGASQTCIDEHLVALLQLQQTGQAKVHTPSTGPLGSLKSTYDIELKLPAIDGTTHAIPALEIVACDFDAQRIEGLLGRDVLQQSRLTYSGPDGLFMMSF
ncbi:MAG: aspartyl protease family protein [Ignavibacteriales bacterium]